MTQYLQTRWQNLWQRLGVAAPANDVIANYEEPQRFYHNRTHLEDVLSKLDWAKEALEKTGEISHLLPAEKTALFDTVELALWYHDAVYDPRAKDNEAKSRDMFLAAACETGLPDALQKEAARLIDITASHKNAKTLPERIMTDCDLAILGADEAAFKTYNDNIRKEYAHVPKALYDTIRPNVLRGFLNQDNIFKTVAFRQQFEKAAARNLSMASLSPIRRVIKRLFRP